MAIAVLVRQHVPNAGTLRMFTFFFSGVSDDNPTDVRPTAANCGDGPSTFGKLFTEANMLIIYHSIALYYPDSDVARGCAPPPVRKVRTTRSP